MCFSVYTPKETVQDIASGIASGSLITLRKVPLRFQRHHVCLCLALPIACLKSYGCEIVTSVTCQVSLLQTAHLADRSFACVVGVLHPSIDRTRVLCLKFLSLTGLFGLFVYNFRARDFQSDVS